MYNEKKPMQVKDIMNLKSPVLYEEDTILNASKFMKEERIRNLPVVNGEKKLVGLITLREIIETVFSNPEKILVRDAMIKIVATVSPDASLKNAIEVMMVNKYGCLPVIDKDHKLVGMASEADLLKKLYELADLPSDFAKTKLKK